MGNKQRSSLFTASLIYFIILVAFVAIRIIVQIIDIPVSEGIFDLISTIVVQVGLMFLFPVLLYSKMQDQKVKTTLNNFGYSKLNLKSVIISIFIGFLCYFLNLSIASFFGTIIRMCGYETVPALSSASTGDYSTSAFIISIISVAVLPAICEETTHRGLLLKGFSSMGIKKAIIFSSLFFGLMHLNINQFFYATVLGFVIALTVIISKNIFPAIIIHFMNNFLSVFFDFARHNNWSGRVIYDFFTKVLYSDNFVTYFIINFLVLVALIFSIVMLFSILLKETRIKKVNNMLTDIAKINQEFSQGSIQFQNDSNLANLHNLNKLMKQYNVKSLNSMVFTDLEIKSKKPTAMEILFLVSSFTIGVLVTVFTFLWGII